MFIIQVALLSYVDTFFCPFFFSFWIESFYNRQPQGINVKYFINKLEVLGFLKKRNKTLSHK